MQLAVFLVLLFEGQVQGTYVFIFLVSRSNGFACAQYAAQLFAGVATERAEETFSWLSRYRFACR